MTDTPTLLLDLAPTSPSCPLHISAKHMIAPALYVFGLLTKFQVGKPVKLLSGPLHGRHCPVQDAILRAAGFDPNDPESMPMPLSASDNISMYRACYYAIYERSESYPRPRGRFLFSGSKKKGWALTETGVAAAVSVYSAFAPAGAPNVTAIWLDGQLGSGLYNTLFSALNGEQKMSREKAAGEISDHIHTFVEASVRRDSFRSWLLRGDAPTSRQLVGWVIRKGISAFRSYGQDAHMRTTRGALTARERSEKAPLPMLPSTYQIVLQGSEDNPEQEQVIVDRAAVEQEAHNIAFSEGLERVREALQRHKPGAADRYGRVFDALVEGASIRDLGQMESVSRNRAAAITADARLAIRAAAQATRDARKILTYISDEPSSTEENIREDVTVDTDLHWLLGELVARGRLQMQGPCYVLAAKGQALLDEWKLLPTDSEGNPVFDGDFGGLVAL